MDIELEFISMEVLKDMALEEKIDYILEKVGGEKILVIDSPLAMGESSRLIEETMKKVSDKFPGIEVSTLNESQEEGWRGRLIKALGGTTGGLTVVGPSKLVKKVKQDPRRITLMAGSGKKK